MADTIDGIFNINKPPGMTSHDVVSVVRRLSGQRRVGHAGTLDPAAEGVLLVCLGQATRVVEYLMGSTKIYCGRVCLGVETDTYDAEGRVVATRPWEHVSRADVENAVASFVGRIRQVPPAYAALKQGGVALYKLARAGVPVEPEAREVEIYSARVLDWIPPSFTLQLVCSPGTYVRSVAHDVGERLGTGAHLSGLVRLASGRFTIQDAVPLPLLSDAFAHSYWQSLIYPIDEALLDADAIILSAEREKDAVQGKTWQATPARSPKHDWVRAYSAEGKLVAITALDVATGQWQPKKVFA